MSVCVETGPLPGQPQEKPPEKPPVEKLLENVVSATPPTTQQVISLPTTTEVKTDHIITSAKSIAKLVVSTHPSASNGSQLLQKVVNPPLITVLNSTGPLTVVKSLCVSSVVSSAPQYTVVNSSTPLNVSNAVGKAPTITVLNCAPLSSPVTVVKAITTQQPQQLPQQTVERPKEVPAGDGSASNTAVVTAVPIAASASIVENRGHNVFVKNTCTDPAQAVVDNLPQSHKLLMANNFSQSNVIAGPIKTQTANGQKSKVKILSNIVVPSSQGPSQAAANLLLNKINPTLKPPQPQQRFLPRQKIVGPNPPASPKYVIKSNVNPSLKAMPDKSPTRLMYPQKQVKTLPPNSFIQKPQQGIKTLSPQHKAIPGQVQRTGSGVRTIPPQRPQKVTGKPHYIGKHAVQAQRMKAPHSKGRGGSKMPLNSSYSYPTAVMPDKQLTFNQALTAQIIETLSNPSPPVNLNRFEILHTRYDGAFSCPDSKPIEPPKDLQEEKAKSGLDALSLICQAVLLDHNYNATLPSETPTRPSPPLSTQAQINGISATTLYSAPGCKRRSLSTSSSIPTSSISNVSLPPASSASLLNKVDDDAASDISDVSDRKHDTEGEETDTAPEAEAVGNEDHYGDYVTRCLCGFLHDDGYMVECDRCKVWQHVQCVVKNKQIPDEYLCEVCDPKKTVDRQKARMIQQQWLRERQLIDPKLRKEAKLGIKHREAPISDSDSSDNEQNISHNNNVIAKSRNTLVNRRRSEGSQKTNKKEQKEPPAKRPKRKERKIVKRKTKAQIKQQNQQSHSDDENQDSWASHLPQLRQWIEKYEEAVTNHYSPELRARISSIRVNGVHSDNNVQYDPNVCKCRVHAQPLTEIKYLVSTVQLAANTPIIELRGKYMLSAQHRNSGGSLTTRQHSQRPGPFLFFYRLHKDNTEVCVDTRTYGNSARFIRRSCKPNAELRHCIEKGVLHLYIVSIASVDKNCELTIKHESHDLAAIGTTHIACACGNPRECTVNKTTIKKNGEIPENNSRRRRGRRTASTCLPSPNLRIKSPVKEEPKPAPVSPPQAVKKEEEEEEKVDIKEEPLEPEPEVKEEVKVKEEIKVKKEEKESTPEPTPPPPAAEIKEEKVEIKEEPKSPPPTPVTTRRSSQYKSDREDSRDGSDTKEDKSDSSNNKKLSREERKLAAILKAIEQMEKANQRKQTHQAKQQAHRRESEPNPNVKDDDKLEPKTKRRRRKGRARTTSTNAQSRRSRLNSTDSYLTSGDEIMLSPSDNAQMGHRNYKENDRNDNKAAGLLLALSNGENIRDKTPPRETTDSNSNSAQSSPETQLSSACLLVQAAVEPLEPGFKFPKTKKGLMNEWLNKAPDTVQSASSISPSSLVPHISTSSDEGNGSFYGTPSKNLSALAQAASFYDNAGQPGSAKKRWLRQAISEDHKGDGTSGRPDSPPLNDSVAPPKKRRLPRESISNDSSPPTTPTGSAPSISVCT